MKLAIIGSRSIKDINIGIYINERPEMIISGGAKGIDTYAAAYARENGIPLREYLPDYQRYGRCATHIRNRKIIEDSDRILAIWDGKSKGTLSSMNIARKLGKELIVVNTNDNEDVSVV